MHIGRDCNLRLHGIVIGRIRYEIYYYCANRVREFANEYSLSKKNRGRPICIGGFLARLCACGQRRMGALCHGAWLLRDALSTMVRYGARGLYARLHTRGGGIPCNNEVFGDPLVGIVKHCEFWAND